MSQAQDRQSILLEAGTNELEVLVFVLGRTRYGVNVAKVREVIGHVDVVKIPMSHPAVVGVFKLRSAVIPLVDLQLYYQPGVPSEASQRTVILMEFNNIQMGFLVDAVERIYRMSWSEVKPMPICQGNANAAITAVCEVDGQLALLVDFEKIAFDIHGQKDAFKEVDEVAVPVAPVRDAQRVLLAEDSPTIRRAIGSNLLSAGYTQVTSVSNGAEAWSLLEASVAVPGSPRFTLVVTDIEMPQMDGLHLCKRIKEHPMLNTTPVVVFSSLVSDSNLKKCEAVGADAAITKPQMKNLVSLLDQLSKRVPTAKSQAQAATLELAGCTA